MKNLNAFLFILLFFTFNVKAQSYAFFTASNQETIQQNAIMPSDSGVYFCMKKNATNSSLYWLSNNNLFEVKNIGTQYDLVNNINGTYGKQWFTNKNKALFVAYSQYTGGNSVFITDGTTLGTDTILNNKYGTNVNIAGMIGDYLYFSTTSLTPFQTIIYKTNFTKLGTSIVKTITKTNLSNNYVDNQRLYLSGYLKSGAYSYAVLYTYDTDTIQLSLGQNYFPAKVINGDLYSYSDGRNLTKRNLTTNVLTQFYFPDAIGGRIYHIDAILGVQNSKIYLKGNLSLSSNNIANCRILVGDVNAVGTITCNELKTPTGKEIPLSNSNFSLIFGDNLAYFYGSNEAQMISIFATDGTNSGTKQIQDIMTWSAWAFAIAGSMKLCGDRVYFYGSDYKIGTAVHAGWALSTGHVSSDGLTIVNLNAGENVSLQQIENFQGKILYTIGSTTSNKIYAINACSSAPTTGVEELNSVENDFIIYPNPSNGNFTIDIKENLAKNKIEIFNLIGNKINDQLIDFSGKLKLNINLKAGIYFVSLTNNRGKICTKKILIE